MGSVGRSKDCRPQYQYTNKVNRCRKSKRQKQNKPTWLHHGWVYQYILRRIPEWTRLQSSHCPVSTLPSGMVLSQIRIVQKILASWSIRGESLEKTNVLQLISEKNLHLNSSQIYVHPYSQKTLLLFVFSIRSLHTLSLSHLGPQLLALRHACLFARGKVWGFVTSRREVWKEWGHSRVLCQYFHILIVKCVNILANIISEKC